MNHSLIKSEQQMKDAIHTLRLRHITRGVEYNQTRHEAHVNKSRARRSEMIENFTALQLWKDARTDDYVNDVDRFIRLLKANLTLSEANISALEQNKTYELRGEDLPNRTEVEKSMRQLAIVRERLATDRGIKDREAKLEHIDGFAHNMVRVYKAVVPNDWRRGLSKFMSWALKMGLREGISWAMDEAGRKDLGKEVRKENVGSMFLTDKEIEKIEAKREKKKAKRKRQNMLTGGYSKEEPERPKRKAVGT
jgi:uncharacterized protein with von Willebrand factor type A (vWA) domain